VNAGLSLETWGRGSEVRLLPEPVCSSLVLEVERVLRATGYMPLRDLRISQQGSTVILSGHVPTYHLKQLAQATVMGVSRVGQIRNEVEVVSRREGM
jgi:hypothetical protein